MKKLERILKILAIIMVIALTAFNGKCSNVYAKENVDGCLIADNTTGNSNETKKVSIEDILNAGSNWIKGGEQAASATGYGTTPEDFVEQFITIGQVLVIIGVGTLVIVSMIMAIKWLTATPDKKAKLQQQLIGLVVATFVIFGALGIWNLIRGIMQNVETKLEGDTNTIVIASVDTNFKA